MSTYQISCTVGTTDPAALLGLEIWIDNTQLFNTNHVAHESLPLTFDLEEDQAVHELRFVMKGKTVEHTEVDLAGNIIKDACITIDKLAFVEIELNQVFVDRAVYRHNFNGTQPEIMTKFYGIMGCNGTVALNFTTPIYLWLLESM
jgi:hypothetical protein